MGAIATAGHLRFVEADKIAAITVGYIRCDLDREEAERLPPPQGGAPVYYANAIDQATPTGPYGDRMYGGMSAGPGGGRSSRLGGNGNAFKHHDRERPVGALLVLGEGGHLVGDQPVEPVALASSPPVVAERRTLPGQHHQL